MKYNGTFYYGRRIFVNKAGGKDALPFVEVVCGAPVLGILAGGRGKGGSVLRNM